MNKYQKALDYLAENSMYETVGRRGREIWKEITHEGIEAQELLQELVDKTTPMRPRIVEDMDFERSQYGLDYYVCPNCENEVEDTYCSHCGQALDWQALDWSEEND